MMIRWWMVGASLALFPGCLHTAYHNGHPSAGQAPAEEDTDNFFFVGLAGDNVIDAKAICGDAEVSRVHTQQTFMDGLLQIVTIGIYTPRSHKVWCAAKPAVAPVVPAAGGQI